MNSSFDHYPLRSEHKPVYLFWRVGKIPASELSHLPGQVMASFLGFFNTDSLSA